MDLMRYISKIRSFMKREAVLSVALALALFSAFLVHPDEESDASVDGQTLILLFCLMTVMAGFQAHGVFTSLGAGLLRRSRSTRQVEITLVLICFFSSMLVTNDVALLTFVPFSLTVLRLAGQESRAVPVVVLQTVAANLGSMFTPIGNPQNLYLYAQSHMSLTRFLLLMLPYTLLSLFLITVLLLLHKKEPITVTLPSSSSSSKKKTLGAYLFLFLACLLAVAKVLPLPFLLILTLGTVLVLEPALLKRVDYSLLLTFVGFFIFVGNIARLPSFNRLLSGWLDGQVAAVAVCVSQIISNVPASLLLSGFTADWEALIVGVNLGGLGTLIASMASLISYKAIAQHSPEKRRPYLIRFTWINVLLLSANGILYGILKQ